MNTASIDEDIDVDDPAAESGVAEADDIIFCIHHVCTSADGLAAEESAERKPCEDFEVPKPLSERGATGVTTGLCPPETIESQQ